MVGSRSICTTRAPGAGSTRIGTQGTSQSTTSTRSADRSAASKAPADRMHQAWSVATFNDLLSPPSATQMPARSARAASVANASGLRPALEVMSRARSDRASSPPSACRSRTSSAGEEGTGEAPNPPRGEVGRSHQHVARDREVTRARRRARRQLHGASDSPTQHARVDHLESPFRVAAHDAGLVSHVLLPVDGVRAAAERPPVLTVGRATRHDDDARRVPEGVVHHGAEVLGPRVDVNEYALRAPGHLEVTVRYRQSDAFESRSGDGWNVRARLAERERRLLDRCRVGARIQEEVLDAVRAEKEKKMLGGRRRRYRPLTRRVVVGGRRWLLQAQR